MVYIYISFLYKKKMKVIESVRMLNITIKLPPDHKFLIQALITSLHTQAYTHKYTCMDVTRK
jgi:hypothetical protein